MQILSLIKHYKIDPYKLNKQTIAAIKASTNEKQALKALKTFVDTFKDGHFKSKRPKKSDDKKDKKTKTIITKYTSAKNACELMDFIWDKNLNFNFLIQGVEVLEERKGEFPYLIIKHNNRKIGIIRIASFRETLYPQSCIEAWDKYKGKIKDACNEKCQEKFRHYFINDILVDNFYKSLEKILSTNVNALVIDLTGNGGGSDWVTEITASAAEDIVARHLDSKTAVAIGSRTTGSGCGYTDGGIKHQLPNTGLNVLVPDCIRERIDGTNEVTGIEPDIEIDMTKTKESDFLYQLATKIDTYITNR